jgi:hypothetical protein
LVIAIQVGQLGKQLEDALSIVIQVSDPTVTYPGFSRQSNFFKGSKMLISFSLFPLKFRCVRFGSFSDNMSRPPQESTVPKLSDNRAQAFSI